MRARCAEADREAAGRNAGTSQERGDPRVNLQKANGNAKPYQVGQLLKAVDRLELSKAAETVPKRKL